jgi:superfamily II DNA or RNA helicase
LGAQVEHQANTKLNKGKQEVVFTKLTDFLDPNTVQVKANGDLTILSVRTRKNFEDIRISNDKIEALNGQRLTLEKKEIALRDEFEILELDKELLMRNRDLKGQDKGISMIELKEAYAFMHQKMNEITVRESAIYDELEKLTKEMNKLEQEIISQRSKPVINYTEIIVEIDVEKETDAIIVASYGTFSTGINIKNLHNIIFASPTKSRVRTMQSIGRGLRISDTKDSMTLFDIADNLSNKNKKNYTLNHLIERVKMYSSEGFPYDLHAIKLRSDDGTGRRSLFSEDE